MACRAIVLDLLFLPVVLWACSDVWDGDGSWRLTWDGGTPV